MLAPVSPIPLTPGGWMGGRGWNCAFRLVPSCACATSAWTSPALAEYVSGLPCPIGRGLYETGVGVPGPIASTEDIVALLPGQHSTAAGGLLSVIEAAPAARTATPP